MFETKCHSCQKAQEVPQHYAARIVRCHFCREEFEALSLEENDLRLERIAIRSEHDRKSDLVSELDENCAIGYLSLTPEFRDLIEREFNKLMGMNLGEWNEMDR
ncbi:MAG: hypothetical protein AAGH89_02630, partial [Verrucomicrobiota bacterium]